jgi:hypothetical protein
MTTFLIHEYMTCEVTFVRRIDAADMEEALELAHDGEGDILGVAIGDTVAGYENTEILPDAPHNIPAAFYSELPAT